MAVLLGGGGSKTEQGIVKIMIQLSYREGETQLNPCLGQSLEPPMFSQTEIRNTELGRHIS